MQPPVAGIFHKPPDNLVTVHVKLVHCRLHLDHSIVKDDNNRQVAAVTGKHYDQDPRIHEKREALQKLADEIKRIVAEPVDSKVVELHRAAK